MEINVKLMSTFEKYNKRCANGKVKVKEGATIQDLVRVIGIPEKYVRIVAVNGNQKDLDTTLSEGDTVLLFPPAIGGG